MTSYLESHKSYGHSPEDLCHRERCRCDQCDRIEDGTMLYSTGATGRICAVMFLCKNCDPVSFKKFPQSALQREKELW